MSFKIAVASGKGGTGKTTVSVNLFKFLSEKLSSEIQLIDCDVEEPNSLFFYNQAELTEAKDAQQLIPQIDTNKCTFCRKCEEYCEFNAITILPKLNHIEVDSTLCHSCGACSVACKFGAITEQPQTIGQISTYTTGIGKNLVVGKLKVGSPMQTMMIGRTKEETDTNCRVTLYDSPPGTSCPVVETVADVDYIVLVTEPTPFGVHDVKLMMDLARELEKPFGIIINKADLGNNELNELIAEQNIELLGQIPFSKQYAANYSTGNLLKNIPEEIYAQYSKITSTILNKI